MNDLKKNFFLNLKKKKKKKKKNELTIEYIYKEMVPTYPFALAGSNTK